MIRSEDYEEGEIYDHDAASSLGATGGLYCASCHTPHGSITGRNTDGVGEADIPTPTGVYSSTGVLTGEFFSGDQLVADDTAASHPHGAYPQWLMSSNPNHLSARAAVAEAETDPNANDKYDIGEPFRDKIIPNGLCDS